MLLSSSHFFASTLLTSRCLRTLLLLCWTCFFALPALNAQGQINGYWVSLCTTNGTELILVQNTDNALEHDQHKSTKCPCAQHIIGTADTPKLKNTSIVHCFQSTFSAFIHPIKTLSPLLPRAPPHIAYF